MRHTHSGVVFLNRVAALAIDVRGNRIDHPATTTSFIRDPASLSTHMSNQRFLPRLVREYYLFRGVKGDETSNEGEGDESQASEGDWELLPVGHLVHVGGEVLFGLVVAGELLGFLTLPEHVEGGRWGGHRRSPGDGGGGGEGADRRHREEGDEEGGKEGGLAHHLLGFSAILFSPLI